MSQRKPKRKKRRGPSAPRTNAPLSAIRDTAGRVHLVLHRDPVGGTVRLGLKTPLFEESWQNELAVSAASTAHTTLQSGLTRERVVALARHAMDATSRLAEGLLARAANGVVACKSGCDHCCHQSVGVTAAEALAVVDHLQRSLSSESLSELTQRLGAARERTRGLSSEQRYSPDHPCPFLESASCSIYEVRPLSCRGMNSLDADECAKNLRDPSARLAFLASGAGGRSFLEPIRAFHAISAGLQLGLSELFRLDMRPLDLTAAVHELLSDTEGVTDAWLAGLSPLESARGGDSSQDVHARDLSGSRRAEPS